jgi:hypothetical protein
VSPYRRLGVATRWAIGGIDRAYRSYRNSLIHSFRMIRPFARSVLTPIRPHAGTPIPLFLAPHIRSGTSIPRSISPVFIVWENRSQSRRRLVRVSPSAVRTGQRS